MISGISYFYLKWTEFMRNCDLCSNYGSLGTQAKWEQNSQFLVNSEKLWHLLSGKKLTEHMESELSGIF